MIWKIFSFFIIANIANLHAKDADSILSAWKAKNHHHHGMKNWKSEAMPLNDGPFTSSRITLYRLMKTNEDNSEEPTSNHKTFSPRLNKLFEDDFEEPSVNNKVNVAQETLYTRRQYGKKYRFHFEVGARQAGDRLLTTNAKHNSWKVDTNATMELKYPGGNKKNGNELTYINVEVYQVIHDHYSFVRIACQIGQIFQKIFFF